ncbi:hypothetical protein P153DRAFT_144941 [Dothidotthia symphoricarpi CBS 119687]|uniref:Uncharacterized protein n=1 Tax=Dothidotthia symphoricarpi CBS 119687 TaxID=1392245 RepID=A0A6A5ZXU5_9PLEO|nr:uncharacterized protein P153DRAFT_144941 [Dothidotthia symphoricarpi CBS 119687]KAF2123724.1 hypothetical protein P153DRAFT_144941 [Dothidotthia symphoricarpi CBS 119687]
MTRHMFRLSHNVLRHPVKDKDLAEGGALRRTTDGEGETTPTSSPSPSRSPHPNPPLQLQQRPHGPELFLALIPRPESQAQARVTHATYQTPRSHSYVLLMRATPTMPATVVPSLTHAEQQAKINPKQAMSRHASTLHRSPRVTDAMYRLANAENEKPAKQTGSSTQVDATSAEIDEGVLFMTISKRRGSGVTEEEWKARHDEVEMRRDSATEGEGKEGGDRV